MPFLNDLWHSHSVCCLAAIKPVMLHLSTITITIHNPSFFITRVCPLAKYKLLEPDGIGTPRDKGRVLAPKVGNQSGIKDGILPRVAETLSIVMACS